MLAVFLEQMRGIWKYIGDTGPIDGKSQFSTLYKAKQVQPPSLTYGDKDSERARLEWNLSCITLQPEMQDPRHQMARKWDPEPVAAKREHAGEVVANSLYS